MANERLLFLDFETYYDDAYSLRKMPTPNYILDDRFEVTCCAVKEHRAAGRIVDGSRFEAFIARYDPAHTTTVTFNALFDNSILAWRYGFVPHRMLDAMGMARALRGHQLPSATLENVARHLGAGVKGNTLPKVKGMGHDDIVNNGLWKEYTDYAIQDVELCADIFYKLYGEFPLSEHHIMDLVLRCTIEPQFIGDKQLMVDHLKDVRKEKQGLLDASGMTREDLMSGPKFQAALEARGIEVEMKTSPAGNLIPAIAKSDGFMQELLESDDEQIQAMAEARLGFKSTLEETRTEKLLGIANLDWPGLPGALPMPLRYGGAHTTRLSGEWGMNVQNFPTPRGSKGKSKLRLALKAPPGHEVVTADLGQIEARITAWICDDQELLKQFRDNLDPYAVLASEIFGRKIDPKVDKMERFIGKTGVLGLGYGAGVPKFNSMVISDSRKFGVDLKGMWTKELAEKTVATYRRARHKIVRNGWYKLNNHIAGAWMGKSGPVRFGPCVISKGTVLLPNGLKLNCERPRWDSERKEYMYTYGRRNLKIYGAKMLENIVQALARIVVMNAAVRIHDRGYRFALQAHDELVFVVPEAKLDEASKIIHAEMTKAPSWAPELPLKAELGHGKSYGEAK